MTAAHGKDDKNTFSSIEWVHNSLFLAPYRAALNFLLNEREKLLLKPVC